MKLKNKTLQENATHRHSMSPLSPKGQNQIPNSNNKKKKRNKSTASNTHTLKDPTN